MNFGLILTGGNPHPWQVSSAQLYQGLVQQAVLAEELGFDAVWTAEHHGTDEYLAAQFPVLAAMAARTRRFGWVPILLSCRCITRFRWPKRPPHLTPCLTDVSI